MSIVRIDHVQVATPPGGESATRRFYGDLLQMPEIEKPPKSPRGGASFQAGGSNCTLGSKSRLSRKAHRAFAVTDLDSLAHRLQAAGVQLTWDEAIAGTRRFFAADPFGNRLEFVQD